MTGPEHVSAFRALAEALDELAIPFHVGGSVASSVWGRGRSTFDVDISIGLDESASDAFASRIEAEFYVDAGVVRDAIRRERSFNVIHLASMVKIGAFPRTNDPYDLAAVQHVRRAALHEGDGARELPVSSPEDIVLRKLRWYRSGGENLGAALGRRHRRAANPGGSVGSRLDEAVGASSPNR